ncbi:MAG: S1 family peptidase [Desulfobacteraceae bacterium]|nr:S1 family peptidase [Desulfobacteraceae bacterium]MBC2721022.1 trypsin-like serine protease [Desulfobacteraceae bacterium]
MKDKMRSISNFLLVVTVVLVIALASVGTAYAITNGQPDGDEHPYVGLVVFDVYVAGVGNVPAWRCSCALISPNVILTAGHCTEGAVAARVWFDEDVEENPEYPFGGVTSTEGTPYTNPDFCIECGNGLPGFAFRDVGVVVLDEPVDTGEYAELPNAGIVDTLKNKTDLDIVGYGVQEQIHGGGPPNWGVSEKVRLYAPSELVSGKFVHSGEYMRITLNPGGGTGGTCFGDSGGPDLLWGTDTILGVNSYVTNYNCAGVGYSSRVDIPEVLKWINGYLQP